MKIYCLKKIADCGNCGWSVGHIDNFKHNANEAYRRAEQYNKEKQCGCKMEVVEQ